MKALIQRVSEASVSVANRPVSAIGEGLLVLFCAEQGDEPGTAEALARKIARLRIFGDAAGKMNLSLIDRSGAALVVSQFTLAADTRRGNRPGFSAAAAPETAKKLLAVFRAALAAEGITVAEGVFGAHMAVGLVNDGPVTIWLDSPPGV